MATSAEPSRSSTGGNYPTPLTTVLRRPLIWSQLIMEYGNRFGELAHTLFPDGTLVDIFNLNKAVEDTRQAIETGAEVIMEAAFCHDQCRILADIVEKQPDGSWHLIKVKSSTRVKNEHIPDLAYQKWVMEQSGHPVSRCSIIHANTSGVWPDISSIFNCVDVTAEVDAASVSVAAYCSNP